MASRMESEGCRNGVGERVLGVRFCGRACVGKSALRSKVGR